MIKEIKLLRGCYAVFDKKVANRYYTFNSIRDENVWIVNSNGNWNSNYWNWNFNYYNHIVVPFLGSQNFIFRPYDNLR